jgi:hypothetical protein
MMAEIDALLPGGALASRLLLSEQADRGDKNKAPNEHDTQNYDHFGQLKTEHGTPPFCPKAFAS